MRSRFDVRPSLLLLAVVAGCADRHPVAPEPDLHQAGPSGAEPTQVVAVPLPGGARQIFPYLTDDLTSNGRDPVNLVFTGQADPRTLRAALMALGGQRSGSFAPFDCTWKDAVGGLQAGWAEGAWVGSVIQLECGSYGPIRFHLRFFEAGGITLGGAHFEFLIPGTTDHQVVSWELAEQLVTYDLARAGVLAAPPATTGALNAAPWFRTIPGFLYQLVTQADPQFAALLGQLGLVDLPGGDKGIPTDGRATLLAITGPPPAVAGTLLQEFDVEFGQVVPKPFCMAGSPSPLLRVDGPVRLTLRTRQDAGGDFRQEMTARGRLTLTPIDPATGAPAGPSYPAEVSETQQVRIDRHGSRIDGTQHQLELPPGVAGRGQLRIRLQVGPHGPPRYDRDERCGPASGR